MYKILPFIVFQSDEDEFAKLKDQSKKERSDSINSDDFQDFTSYQENQDTSFPPASTAGPSEGITHSSTAESLVDAQAAKSFTPSMSSSGYGSQAVSTQTLSSEDSTSVRSISIDDTPEQSEQIQTRKTAANRPSTLEKTNSNDKILETNKINEAHKINEVNKVNDAHKINEVNKDNETLKVNKVNKDNETQKVNKVNKDNEAHKVNKVNEENNKIVITEHIDSENKPATVKVDTKLVDNGLGTTLSLNNKNLSLIDTDIPSNLGTPLEPLSPEDDTPEETTIMDVPEIKLEIREEGDEIKPVETIQEEAEPDIKDTTPTVSQVKEQVS